MIVWLGLLVGIIGIIVIMFVYYFNKFVLLGNRIDNSLSQINVQLKRRADLIPNLMESVKGYMKHEKGIMTEVTNARKVLIGAKDISSKVKAGDQLQNALGRLFMIAENYPQLRANENFLQFQGELTSIEDKIAYSRQFYNDSILSYNNSVETFPGVIFASIFGKSEKEFLQISAAEKTIPKVNF